MPRKQKKHHFIYKTTNLLNEKFYVGMHSTDNLEDGYVGSGKRLGYSIRKYGLENHKFEILEFLPSREELKKREAEVVNEEMLKHPLCMNLKFGGEGGWDHINSDDVERNRIQIARSSAGGSKRAEIFSKGSEAAKERHRRGIEGKMKKYGKVPSGDWTGKTHKEETKIKISSSMKEAVRGEKNSQFGTCWINNGSEAKKIKKDELQSWENQGWKAGRKLETGQAGNAAPC